MKLDRLFLYIHVILIILLLSTLANAWVGPDALSNLNTLSLIFPYLLILHIIFTIIWGIKRKKIAWLFFAITFIFYNPARRWINITPQNKISKNKKTEIKVITFNVKYGDAGWQNLRKYIRKQNADLIFIQERDTQTVIKKDLIKYPCVVLKTKHPIIRQGTLLNDKTRGNSFFADVNINGTIVRVINVYLEPFRLNKNMLGMKDEFVENQDNKIKALFARLLPTFRTHEDQVNKIRLAIDKSPYPVILAGDFNSVPNSWEYYNLGKNLKDAFLEVGDGSGTSFHEYKFPLRIDYIFSSHHIEPISYKVDYSVKLSDHYPVIAEFLLN